MKETIFEIISKLANVKPENIKPEDNLESDLNLDSLMRFALLSDIEDAFNIVVPDRKFMTIQTVEDVLNAAKELIG